MESNKIKHTTNRAQFGKMVIMMKTQPDIAKNLTKVSPEVVLEFWQNLKDELNSLGPPIKETAEWKKVWSDYKSALRKKLAHNKRELKSTGGGANTQMVFTTQDEEIIELVSLRDAVDGINANKFGVPRKRTIHDANNSSVDIENLPTFDDFVISPSSMVENEVEIELPNVESNTEVRQTAKAPKQIKLLEKQVGIQEKLYNNIAKWSENQDKRWDEFNLNQKKIYRAVEKLNDRQKEANQIFKAQLEESKRHNQRMEQLALDKNKTKQKILELELEKIENSIRN